MFNQHYISSTKPLTHVLLVTSLLLSSYSLASQKLQTLSTRNLPQSDALQTRAVKKEEANKLMQQRYIVQFKAPALSSQMVSEAKQSNLTATSKANIKPQLSSLSAKSYQSSLQRSHSNFAATLSRVAPEVKVHKKFTSLLNGMEVEASEAQITQLRALPEVKQIYPVRKRYINLDRSHEVIKSAAAWQILGGQSKAGEGVKIAIVDTGIRNDNPMFSDQGISAADLSTNTYLTQHPDYCRSPQGDANFCNNKLIIARWIDPAEHDMEVYENEHLSPLGFNGHGTHVAGIASGVPVTTQYQGAELSLSGVAPASYLMVYKALYVDPLGNASGTDTMLLEALEHAVNDGADVINNSWGAGSGEDPNASIYKEVFANAEALGVVIVNAAGNDLHSVQGQTINCPACIESGIAVANTTHGRHIGQKLNVGGEEFMVYPGDNQAVSQDSSLILTSLDSYAPGADGCEAWETPVFEHAIVLVDYKHNCSYEEVAETVKSAGGDMALLYYSGVFGLAVTAPLIPIEGDYAVPLLGVARDDGLRLAELAYGNKYVAHVEAGIHSNVDEQFSDMMQPFSSTGPNNDLHVLKPDMAAPGTDILSAWSPDEFISGPPPLGAGHKSVQQEGEVFAMLTGTSMASPHVAGAAALLKQAHSDWSAKQIKSALTSTTNPNVRLGLEQANAFWAGSGRMDLEEAIKANLTFDKVSYTDPACLDDCIFANQLSNMANEESHWTAKVEFDDVVSTGELSVSDFTLKAMGQEGSSAEFTLDVDTSLAEPGSWVFGRVVFMNDKQQEQHLPIAVYANDTSDDGILTLSTESHDLTSSDKVSFTAQVRNKNLSASPQLQLSIPANAQFVPGSEQAEVMHGQTAFLGLDTEGKNLLWRGELDKGKMQVLETTAWGNTTLASLGVEPIKCNEEIIDCISFSTVVDFDFNYNGESYTSLTLSDNGFVIPGEVYVDDYAALFNLRLPKVDQLTNVIAPFWTEFLLDGYVREANDFNSDPQKGAGYLRSAIRVIDGLSYLVVEWDSVTLPYYADLHTETRPYTFQLIIEQSTDNIWFNYLDIPSMPAEVTIGADNRAGDIGVSYHFDGEGNSLPATIPASGYSLKLVTQQAGVANIHYQMTLADEQSYSNIDEFEVNEEMQSLLDVLANDQNDTHLVASATLQAGAQYNATRATRLAPSSGLDLASFELVSAPSHGSASIVDGQISYQSAADFFGQDSLSYRIADGAGKYSKATKVDIKVLNVNDAPVVSAGTDQVSEAGKTVSLTISATDADGDQLQYTWQQSAGIIVPFEQKDNSISFIAPQVDKNTELSFTVSATDGKLASNEVTFKVKVNKGGAAGKGGSIYGLSFLALLILIYRIVYPYRGERN
jgi:minor extracellular serine protease Vpr